ncbi:hypothetical protein CBR_g20188 [Chara braunii]|uniref:Shikimate dehydrogenase substrate binding N-terminal domain-containing protein n=1 Tax=Chara braunii TaxID=69332 RepID=A0A388KZR9_CHABU|nr:hypothetical protein CBR_g20188 [Chara braunii]|eukprot:GBG75557.1 hypothetical protein CBR_g20188 [Chara braunii]
MAETCRICASLVADSMEGMMEAIALAKSEGADMVELRLDLIKDFKGGEDLARLLTSRLLPAIVTFRPTWEYGQYDGDEETRQQVLRRAVELGADFIDVELQVAQSFVCKHQSLLESSRPNTRVIVSSHNYQSTPSSEDLATLAAKIISTGADIVKIAVMASTITDTSRVFELLSHAQVPTIALSMGEYGLISRLLAPKFGGFLTFGCLGQGKESAPGQPTVTELVDIYRLRSQGRDTRVYGLIGKPVSQSKGPLIHNAAMEKNGFNGVYVPFLVDNVPEFLDVFGSSPDFGGFSVTIPHKEAAMSCCSHEVDPSVQSLGALNTLVNKGQKLLGYNTDWNAATSAVEEGLIEREKLRKGIEIDGSRVLEGRLVVVLGAGGAGKGLVYGAKTRGAHVVIANRSHGRAVELAIRQGAIAVPLSEVCEDGAVERLLEKVRAQHSDLQDKEPVLVNTTSVGMVPNVEETPVPVGALKGYGLVFDAIYNPLETRLLREAKSVGATIVSGLEMFVRQANAQFNLFTGEQDQHHRRPYQQF